MQRQLHGTQSNFSRRVCLANNWDDTEIAKAAAWAYYRRLLQFAIQLPAVFKAARLPASFRIRLKPVQDIFGDSLQPFRPGELFNYQHFLIVLAGFLAAGAFAGCQ